MEHNLPFIIPTPSGYDFARKLERHLREHYLPRRPEYQRIQSVWINTEVTIFADTDSMVEIKQHIRGCDVYIVADIESAATILPFHTEGRPLSHKIVMERDSYKVVHNGATLDAEPRKASISRNFDILLSTIDAARNAVKENGRITVVVPFFPSSRQDRRGGRRSLDLKRRCVQIEDAGADHILTIDIHNESTELAFNLRTGFDSLFAAHTFLNFLQSRDLTNAYFVAPDAGAFKRNWALAEGLGLPVSFLYKHRDLAVANVVNGNFGFGGNIEDIAGKDVYIVDDMIDTAGTLIEAVKFLKSNGAGSVTAVATHGIFSPPAVTRLDEAFRQKLLNEVIVTDSITQSPAVLKAQWLTVVDISKYFTKAIDRLNKGESISELLREVG